MTSNDAPQFLRGLAVLAETFAEGVSEERAMAYFKALSDLPLDMVTHGMEQAIARSTFFPKPAEIRDWARGRDPRLMDAARKRGWDPENPRFLPHYDGQGPNSPASREPLPDYLPSAEDRPRLTYD